MLWLIRLRYNFIDSIAISMMIIALIHGKFLFATVAMIGGITLNTILTMVFNSRKKPMTYNDLDIKISINLGQRASAVLSSKNELLIVQSQKYNRQVVINLGPLTEAQAKELGECLQHLARHSV